MSDLSSRYVRPHNVVGDEPVVKRAGGFRFTEGPVWSANRSVLIFSDIPAGRMFTFDPSSDAVEVYRRDSNKANGNCFDLEGRLVTCEHATSRVVREEHDGSMTVLASHFDGRELNSPNDIVVDSQGRLYFTDPGYGRRLGEGSLFEVGIPRAEEQPVRGVYRLDPKSGEIIRLVDDFVGPNGLCLAENETVLYINDSEKKHIRRFGILEHGLSGGEIWSVLEGDEPGVPDGMKMDAEGNLYCSGPAGLHVFDRHGGLLGVVIVPETIGNFGWGDADRQTLYLTATSSLYSCRTNISGSRWPPIAWRE